jgi:hypothetical protein
VRARSAAGTAALIAQRARGVVAPAPMTCRVIAIDGPGGAGKSAHPEERDAKRERRDHNREG